MTIKLKQARKKKGLTQEELAIKSINIGDDLYDDNEWIVEDIKW